MASRQEKSTAYLQTKIEHVNYQKKGIFDMSSFTISMFYLFFDLTRGASPLTITISIIFVIFSLRPHRKNNSYQTAYRKNQQYTQNYQKKH